MKTIFVLLLAANLSIAVSRADVVIYRGVATVAADVTSAAQYAKTVNVYFVVDYANAQYGSILFGRINGGKRFQEGTATTANFASAPLAQGHTASIIVNTTKNDTSPTVFGNSCLYFRGTDKSLLIQKTPTTVIISRPNSLKGITIAAFRNGSDGTFGEERFGMTFQGTPTIQANNANRTIQQVLDGFAAGLIAKGFTEL